MRAFHFSGTRIRRLAVVTASLMALCGALRSTPARAQTLEAPRHRQGYYFALGYQLGGAKIWEDGESWNVWRSSDLSLRMGELLTKRFGLGLQLFHFGSATGQGQRATTGGLGLEAQWELVNASTSWGMALRSSALALS